jgi:hypothetical protein
MNEGGGGDGADTTVGACELAELEDLGGQGPTMLSSGISQPVRPSSGIECPKKAIRASYVSIGDVSC